MTLPQHHRWFPEARYGMFIHWGPYAQYGRGEQVLFREHLDQQQYTDAACAWNPAVCDMREWARIAVEGGFRYAVLTTRHHDGFCLWDSALTDYTSAGQASGRDFVREYVDAFRDAGLRVGLYYSLADWRLPAYWDGPEQDPDGFGAFIDYVHGQVDELLTSYGPIDVMWFDGAWPYSAEQWRAAELVSQMRSRQPEILINNRLGKADATNAQDVEAAGGTATLGDFGTPEHHITAEAGRIWESCNTSTFRLWGYTIGEHWRSPEQWLEMLITASVKGGNLLLNVGPDAQGMIPPPFEARSAAVGQWLEANGEAVFGVEPGDVCEFITYGYQTRKGNDLYLILRFNDGRGSINLAGLETRVLRASLLSTGEELVFEQSEDHVVVGGLPAFTPFDLYPVVKLECEGPPRPRSWAAERLWQGDPRRMTEWARARGESVWADGERR